MCLNHSLRAWKINHKKKKKRIVFPGVMLFSTCRNLVNFSKWTAKLIQNSDICYEQVCGGGWEHCRWPWARLWSWAPRARFDSWHMLDNPFPKYISKHQCVSSPAVINSQAILIFKLILPPHRSAGWWCVGLRPRAPP